MYYQKTITVLTTNIEANPVVDTLALVPGRLKRVLIGFPPGCSGRVHVQILRHTRQIVPWTLGESIAWDAHLFSLDYDLPLEEVPHRVGIVAWSDDNEYDHEIMIGVEMATDENRWLMEALFALS